VEQTTRTPLAGPERQRDAVRAHLVSVLASETFRRAPLASALLGYLVDCGLSERILKEYSIATEALGRSVGFDPRLDSAVRVEARRLRQELLEFYTGDGRDSDVVFELPRAGAPGHGGAANPKGVIGIFLPATSEASTCPARLLSFRAANAAVMGIRRSGLRTGAAGSDGLSSLGGRQNFHHCVGLRTDGTGRKELPRFVEQAAFARSAPASRAEALAEAEIPRVPALRMAGRRLRPFPLPRLWSRPAGPVLVQGPSVLSELRPFDAAQGRPEQGRGTGGGAWRNALRTW
jgi:hypothetical protein